MHHQAAQKTAELLEHGFIVLINMAVIEHIIFPTGRGDAVVNAIKTDRHAYHDGDHGQCIEERGQEGGGYAEGQRQQHFRANAQQQSGKNKQQ
ncbi:hypothetical protein D3C73_1488460 [compost metagenome]